MPLKKVDKYSSKMTYAVCWSTPLLTFHQSDAIRFPNSRSYWSLSYNAIGVHTTKGELEITYGNLWGVSIYTEEDVSEIAWQNLMGVFINDYDTRYGIRVVAKLSGEDDIKLSNSHSFIDYKHYYEELNVYREQLKLYGTVRNFEGWYHNA